MTLPILVVETAHSRYEIDQNEGVYRRTRVHEDANVLGFGVGNAGEATAYEDIALSSLHEGGQIVIAHKNGAVLHSTAIQSVTEVPAEVAA